ncbi:UPF0481 protein At3g47200-like [Abrus precatorius]|uniref:UPF0481 protein At3g47200-like n=1 Tax=Abrus precatorius TaxID=3816 RepID=A0A8B8LQM2_ABRPR|nr:UPF0481 protein At3g47200-like [Abrus precatorius]
MTEKSHLSLRFAQLEKAKQIPQNPVPKIQRVLHHLRDRKHFAKHYSPRLVSIGPIHHGAENLKLGEKYKLMWAAMYLGRTKQDEQTLYQKVATNIKQLKKLFAEDVIVHYPDDEILSWMLFVDGCSLLQILEKGKLNKPEEMNVKVDQLVLVWQDVLLLENQLPYQVLKLLSGHDNGAMLIDSMNEFLKCHHLWPGENRSKEGTQQGEHRVEISQESSTPIHLLDQLRRTILIDPYNSLQDQKDKDKMNNKSQKNTNENFKMTTHRNIQELKATGIRLKISHSRRLKDIYFSSGYLVAELKLPEIIVDDSTAPTFLNLIAYEMCPDFENNYEVCSFVAFMDSLIDHPDDVKELRSSGVLHNSLGSDEEVATLFNTISADLVPDTERYERVRSDIEKHYRTKWKTWIALGYHTYFSNPWAIIAFHAAVVALVLTFIQTWFAINPSD